MRRSVTRWTRRRGVLSLGAIIALAGGMAITAPATAGAVSAPPRVASFQEAAPFTVKAGSLYGIRSTLSGIHQGDRLALESKQGKWRILGYYSLRAGQTKLAVNAGTSRPGLFTLRLAIQRNGRILPSSIGNAFQVKVVGFSVPKARRPKVSSSGHSLKPATTLTDWNSVQCGAAYPGLSVSILIPSPIRQLPGTRVVNQVVWVRDAIPGGTYGAWNIDSAQQQVVQPPQPGIVQISEYGTSDLPDSSYLVDSNVAFKPNDYYHQVAWDLQVRNPQTGVWSYVSSNTYEPNSYIQWSRDGLTSSQSANCETYAKGG